MENLGIIQKIEEIEITIHGSPMMGYKITTDKHTFELLINNDQQCCEHAGFCSCNEDLDYFIGSELIKVEQTDTALNKQLLLDSEHIDLDVEYCETNIQFVDFTTNLGVFQIAVYNTHNGYYGHEIMFKKDNDCILNVWL